MVPCREVDFHALLGIAVVFIPLMLLWFTCLHIYLRHERMKVWESWGGPETLRSWGWHEAAAELERYRAGKGRRA